MKPLKTKAQIRQELEEAMSAFQNEGGYVREVPRGLSGIPDNTNLFAQGFNGKTAQARTSVGDEVKALEARKSAAIKKKNRRPKRKLLKDDFGEPLRWVWED